MKHTMKKLMSVLLTAVMVFGMLPVQVFAEGETECLHENATVETGVPAGCHTDGMLEHSYCEACGSYLVNGTAVDKTELVLQHTAEIVYNAANAQTCMTDGNTEHWQCQGCNGTFADSDCTQSVDDVTIPADGESHVWGENYQPDEVDTHSYYCQEEGCTERKDTQSCYDDNEDGNCDKCDGEMPVEDETVADDPVIIVLEGVDGFDIDGAVMKITYTKIPDYIGETSIDTYALFSDEFHVDGYFMNMSYPPVGLEFTLEEVEAPSGYELSTDVYEVKVGEDGKIKAYKNGSKKAQKVTADNPLVFSHKLTTYDYTFPVTIVVEKGGNKTPGKQTMTFDVLPGILPCSMEEDGFELSVNSVTVKGKGTFNKTLTLSALDEYVATNGFILYQTNKDTGSWEFSKEAYFILPEGNLARSVEMTDVNYIVHPVDIETGNIDWNTHLTVDDIVFTSTYTANKKAEKPAPPHVPDTSDTTGTGRYISLMAASAALVALIEYKKRRS